MCVWNGQMVMARLFYPHLTTVTIKKNWASTIFADVYCTYTPIAL